MLKWSFQYYGKKIFINEFYETNLKPSSDLGVDDFEPRVINQLLEFTYRYVTTILDDAKYDPVERHKNCN